MLRRFTRFSFAASLAFAFALGGCALTGKSDPIVPRFFSPDVAAPGTPVHLTAAESGGGARPTAGPALRLGRIVAAAHLREKIAYRTTNHELGFYEEQRWTERPDVYVRRALERRLFESGAFQHVVSGEAPTLDVEVLSFDEVRGARPVAEIKLHVVLADDRVVSYEETVVVDQDIARDRQPPGEALAAAMATAIARAVDHVADGAKRALLLPQVTR